MAERDPVQTLERLEQALDKRVGGILWQNLTRLRDYLRAHSGLRVRTRGMPYVRRPIRLQGSIIEAGLYAPGPWAGAHIGPAGSVTTITPKRGRFLALPTEFVKQFRGHPVGPRQYGGTVIFGGIIWGGLGWGRMRGKVKYSDNFHQSAFTQRRAAGEIFRKEGLVPLFILKKSVIIRRRIDPAAAIAWIQPRFLADLKKSCLVPQ